MHKTTADSIALDRLLTMKNMGKVLMRLIVMLNLPTFWVTTFLKLEEKEELKKGIIFKNENDTGRTRTHNFWVCPPTLYQLSWRGGPGMGA